MITTTVSELRTGNYPNGYYVIYVFRSGRDVFYVGMSKDAVRRVSEHLAGQRSNVNLQTILRLENSPFFSVDFYSGLDIIQAKNLTTAFNAFYERQLTLGAMPKELFAHVWVEDMVQDFESQLIRELSPVCNGTGKVGDIGKVNEVFECYLKHEVDLSVVPADLLPC